MLAPGIAPSAAEVEEEGTTAEDGTATLSVPDFQSGATIEALPPAETQLARTPVNLSGITEDQTRIVAFGRSTTDTTPPEINCATPEAGWHAENVTVVCTASDSGSGLAHPEDASFSLSTNVATGEETATAYTGTRRVCDKADNCAEAGPIGPIEIDRKAPSISVSSPEEGEVIDQGAGVKAEYTCADGGSGVASCEGSIPSGSALDTASPGQYTLSVAATDAVGHAFSRTVHYTVVAPGECGESAQLCQTGLGDTTPPQVVSLTVNPSSVNTSSGAQSVTVAVHATDNLSGVSAIEVNLSNGSQWITAPAALAAGGTKLNGTWEATLTLPQYSAEGKYALSVGAIDNVGNHHTYSEQELETLGFPGAVTQAGAGDDTPPQVSGVSATPSSVSTCGSAQTVSVVVDASDSVGVAGVSVDLTGPGGQRLSAPATLVDDGGTAANGRWAATLTLPQYAQEGNWLISVQAVDAAGNLLYLSSTQLAASAYTSSVAQTCAGDTTPPQVEGVTLSPESLNTAGGPQAVTVAVHATDGLSGVASLGATLSSGSQTHSAQAVLRAGGTALDGTWLATITLPRWSREGTWQLSLTATDEVGNAVSLSSSQIAALGFPSSISQTGEGDSTPPVVVGGSVNPSTIDTSQGPVQVHVHLHATDAQSGTALVEAQFTSPHGQRVSAAGTLVSGTPQNGEWAATLEFPRYSEQGGWNLQLELWDEFGNHVTYNSSELSAKGLFSRVGVGVAPEFGRCVKVTPETVGKKTIYHGGFTDATCLKVSETRTGRYEWEPGVLKMRFMTAIKELTKVKLETVKGSKVTCTGETGSGEYTGLKTVGDVVLTLTGCEIAGGKAKCASSGAAAGEIVTQTA